MQKKTRLHIVLDNIRSVFNVGSIFRTADATGCAKLYLCGMTAKPDNIKMFKTALGATENVHWEYFNDTTEALEKLKKQGIKIVGVELTDKSIHFQSYKYPNEVALVFGHEKRGVTQPVLDLCDDVIMIPMGGVKESLNVATTAGIIMFEAIRNMD